MYQPMRRKKYEKTEQDGWAYLDRAEWGVLSLCADGLPYGVPLSHARVGSTLYFHCALEGQKLEFLKANPVAMFTAVASAKVLRARGSTAYECAMAFGKVRVVEHDEERPVGFNAINGRFTEDKALGLSFIEKWGKDALVLAMDVERVTAKSIPEGV